MRGPRFNLPMRANEKDIKRRSNETYAPQQRRIFHQLDRVENLPPTPSPAIDTVSRVVKRGGVKTPWDMDVNLKRPT